eukprot:augustus_masked-scaffold_39-processed-gene-2.94-mRNA-1 protein AED:0.11 eAED:0.11 QI:0/-1/0/1/-1/1/1/0/274
MFKAITLGTIASLVKGTNLFDCDVDDFYGSFDPDDYSSAASLKSALHNLIDNHEVISYDDARFALEDIDAQGSGVRGIYTLDTKTEWASGDNAWNREHVWPRSRGLDSSGADNSDIFNLFPCDVNINSARGNKFYDYCTLGENGCVQPAGTSSEDAHSTTREDDDTWAPPTSVRGDLARAVFYMAVRYDGSDSSTTNLELDECSGNTCPTNTFGRLSTLLEWHEDDPVSSSERTRVNNICNDYQGNRNPFVDFPELVERVFGSRRQLEEEKVDN